MDTTYHLYVKKYPWMKHYSSAKKRCNYKKNINYHRYGGKGIKFLLTKNEIKVLWFKDKAYLLKRPSLDRINNSTNYILENCQFIENSINSAKPHERISKKLKQYDSNGDFIKEWPSVRSAIINLKCDKRAMSSHLNKKRNSINGYIFKYA